MQLKFLRIQLFAALFALTLVAAVAALTFSSRSSPAISAAENAPDLEVTFTKWVIGEGPHIAGTVSGDAGAGSLSAELITVDPTVAHDLVTEIEAVYRINGSDHSFVAHFDVRLYNTTGTGYFDGLVMDGWMAGSRIGGEFMSYKCDQGTCFDGVMHLLRRPVR